MCGISGFYTNESAEDCSDTLRKISSLQNHRGPDNESFTIYKHVGFAHNRLSLLDLSNAANQPFEDDRYILVYNGEIYNFESLKALVKDYTFKTSSDTEVLFALLKQHGIDKTVANIEGMFAFAFYDKFSDELILCRDRFGIKPLFYSFKESKTFWFASEIKALTTNLNLELNSTRTLFSCFGNQERSQNLTNWNDVKLVQPGTYVSFKNNTIRVSTYYQLLETIDEQTYRRLDNASERDVYNELDNLLSTSVQKMLVADAPMGVFLSGGVDSSLISYYAKKYSADVQFFTSNVVGNLSEFKDGQTVANYLNVNLVSQEFQETDILKNIVETTWHYECPIVVHPNAMPFSKLAQKTNEYSVKAVLTGEGADELFLGYPRLLTKRYDSIIKFPINCLDKLYAFSPKLSGYLNKKNGAEGLLDVFQNGSRNYNRELFDDSAKAAYSFLKDSEAQNMAITPTMIQEHLQSLLWRNDRMGMMYSIESRFPFLDESVVRFAMNLPSKYKISRINKFYNYKHPFLIDKKIVRKISENKLPAAIVYKKKNGFPIKGLRNIHIQPEFFYDSMFSNLFGLSRNEINHMIQNESNYHTAILGAFEIWARLFVEKIPKEKVQEDVLRFFRLK